MTTEKMTLFIVKPDAVARNLTGSIIERFEQKGFKILHLKMFQFTKSQAEKFYQVHSEKPFFGELTSFICSENKGNQKLVNLSHKAKRLLLNS